MSEAEERAAFEAYMSKDGKWPKSVMRNYEGGYLLMQTAAAWAVWQARATITDKPVAAAAQSLMGAQSKTDAERKAFETYFVTSRRSKGSKRVITFERYPDDGTYKDDHTQRHWWTWQCSRLALAAATGEQP